MEGQLVEVNDRELSRRVVARGLGGGAMATLAALNLRTPVRAGAAQGATPSATDQAILDAWEAAWSSGSSENVASLFTEDGVYEDVPFEERVSGRAAIAEYAQGYFDLAQDVSLRVESAVEIPNGYVVQWRDEYTFAPTGGRVTYRGMSILEVADGELAREVAYYDRATIAAQEGGTCDGLTAAATPEAGA
ncbi:MAG: nuclear transport factor 2 family protein [Actinomycetota bacterium]|nr:nuclear transport factor 2 family protein [Actinomycetota bacterium]MDQ3694133.1 nuclear transport factor 2 family protein [Chloroflexota bacterium]